MQGSILSVGSTGNQGIILGDDGTRYTFIPGGWMDGSVQATAGMNVDFQPVGSQAASIRVVGGAGAAWPPGSAPGIPNPPVSPGGPPYASTQIPQRPQAVSQPPQVSPVPPSQTPASEADESTSGQNPFNRWLESRGSLGVLGIDIDLWRTTKGLLIMCLTTILLGVFLPIIGQLIGGFFGGRVAGSTLQAVVAASISVVVTAAAFLVVGGILPILPLIVGGMISEWLGEALPAEIIFATFLNALPILLGALASNWK